MVVVQRAAHTVWTPANAVSMVRLAVSPLVVLSIYWYAPSWWVLVFVLAAMMTDKLDGYLARRYGISELGIFLDPLADKFMVIGSLGALVLLGWVWWVPAALIAARELAMSWWRSKLARQGISVPARQLAKYKMVVQSAAISLALIPGVIENSKWLVTTAIWIAVALTWITFIQYMRDSQYHVKGKVPGS